MYVARDVANKVHDSTRGIDSQECDKIHGSNHARSHDEHRNRYFSRMELRKMVLDELHQVPYSTHLGYQKKIAAACKLYFWIGMKKDIADYISIC